MINDRAGMLRKTYFVLDSENTLIAITTDYVLASRKAVENGGTVTTDKNSVSI